MIDTLKIYTEIDEETYNFINSVSIIKTSFNNDTKDIFYKITNDHLEGSFSSSLSVRVDSGVKYGFSNLGYCIEIEGSYHKLIYGYNSHNGFYNLQDICYNLIKFVEDYYNIKLPEINHWFLQRVDIAICFDLKNQKNVCSYINSLSRCNYPRRKVKFFYDESIYISGTTSTLKIYNKLLEFKKHDLKKFINTSFDLINYLNKIDGFVRFECEIKKKMLKKLYNKNNINVVDINYNELKNIWSDEFMKILNFVKNDLEIVRSREEVYTRLCNLYKLSKANLLYNFYCSIQLNGISEVKSHTSSSSYYRYIKELKFARIDFSQSFKVKEIDDIFHFNPFEYKEVV